jgi:hypothetical protein
MATVPTYPDSHPFLPVGDFRADRIENAYDLVAQDTWKLNSRDGTRHRETVAMADATSFHFDPYLPRSGLRSLLIDEFQGPVGLFHLHGLHQGHNNPLPV